MNGVADYRQIVMSRAFFRRIMRCMVACVALIVSVLLSQAPLSAHRPTTLPDQIEVRLIGQNFNVSIGRQFRFVLSIPNNNTKQELLTTPQTVLRVEVHTAATSRAEVRDIVQGSTPPQVVETVDLDIRDVTTNENGDLVAVIASGSARDEIGIRKTGVYPVSLSLRTGTVERFRFTTFINFITGQTSSNTLSVSVVAELVPPVNQLPNGEVAVIDSTRTTLQNLVGALSGEGGAMSLSVSPELLNSLAISENPNDAALLGSLQLAMSRHQILASTFVPFDVSSAQRSNLATVFIQQLDRGKQILDLRNGDTPINPRTWFSTRPISREGISLLAQLGYTNVVFSPNAARSIGSLDSYSLQYRADYVSPDGPRVSLGVSDPVYAASLSRSTSSPVLASMGIAAELVTQQSELSRSQNQTLRDHVIVSTLDGSVPNPVLLNSLLVALSRAPQLALRPLSAIPRPTAASTPVSMPSSTAVDLASRRSSIKDLTSVIASTATMLDSPITERMWWDDALLLVQSDTLNSDRFADYTKGLTAQLRSFRAQVSVPESLTFTLGGKTSDLRLQLRNSSSTPMSVLVTLSSAKLSFPEKPQVVRVDANSATDLIIPVVARANGTFPLEVVLYTPDGLTQVGKRIRLSARVSALAGLGQLASGVAILLLMSWWIAHWRKQNRAKATENHPALR